MPRFDGSYPNLGIQTHPNTLLKAAIPQVDCVFADMGITGELAGSATPAASTGSLALDPSPFIDLGDTPVYCDGTFAHPFNSTDLAAFTFTNLKVGTRGSGVVIHVTPEPGVWEAALCILDADDGYIAKISSDGVLSISSVVNGSETVLKTTSVSISGESLFEFRWDGVGGLTTVCGNATLFVVDGTHNPVGFSLLTRFRNCKVRDFVGGVTDGATFDVIATERGLNFSETMVYDGDEFPWPDLGNLPVLGSDDTQFVSLLTEMQNQSLIPFCTLAFAPSEYVSNDATPSGAPELSIVDAWVDILSNYPTVNDFIVWKDNLGMLCGSDSGSSYYDATPGCTMGSWDYRRYAELFQAVDTTFRSVRPGVRLYGPNIHLGARGEGYDDLFNGVSLDSRDIDFLELFLASSQAATPEFTFDGVAISGEFDSGEWPLVIQYLKSLVGSTPLVIMDGTGFGYTAQDGANDYLELMNDNLDSGDYAFVDLSGSTPPFFNSPQLSTSNYGWSFTGILTVPSEMIGAELRVASISEKILLNGSILIQNDSATPFYLASELPTGNGRLSLGNLEEGVYRISIYGDRGESGTAILRIGIYSDNFDTLTLASTKYL